MKSRNLLPFILMVTSIILLLALQVFWLKNSYEKAYFDLRKETNDLFRTTVHTLRDTFLVRNMERVPFDSSMMNGKERALFITQLVDSLKITGGRKKASEGQPKNKQSQLQIFISSDSPPSDSIKAVLRPVASKILGSHHEGLGNFFVRINTHSNSLSVDTLGYHFHRALTDARIQADFKIKRDSFLPAPVELSGSHGVFKRSEESMESLKEASVFSDSMHSEWVRLDPVNRYSTVLTGFRPILLKEITPQILFSGFLTLLTAAAFIIMYRSIRSQQRLMELKNDFISNITHELKTPVTTVSVALEALKNFKGLENPRLTSEYLDIAQNELNRLSILTDKILNTAVFENNGVDFQPEEVDLEKVISQILNSMKLVFEKHGAEIQFEKTGSDFTVNGGTVHLTNVLYNLLDNSLKYNVAPPRILVELKDLDDNILLIVKDNGIGIASAYRKKIFEKFFRVPTGDVHNIKGYGLGLSYVDSVIKGHHGTIAVDSVPEQGSTFTIILPRRGAALPKK